MSMNITKFLRILLNESGMDGMYRFAPGERHVELVAAQAQIASFVAAYDALAPKPDTWREWARWSAIHANGLRYWFEHEPSWQYGDTGWDRNGGKQEFDCEESLPLGIDWRLCKWQRPEVRA